MDIKRERQRTTLFLTEPDERFMAPMSVHPTACIQVDEIRIGMDGVRVAGNLFYRNHLQDHRSSSDITNEVLMNVSTPETVRAVVITELGNLGIEIAEE